MKENDGEVTTEYPEPPKNQQQGRGENVFGMFKTVTVIPTLPPKNWFDQIVIYKSGATKRLYWYDVTNHEWDYSTGT